MDEPQTITYTCDTPDRGKAYWLNVRRFADPHLRVTVNAAITGRGAEQALSLLMPNAEVLELDTGKMPIDSRESLLVQVGNQLLTVEAPLATRLYVVRGDDRWSVTNKWIAPKNKARPYRAGAAADLFTGEPLLIVYGTQGPDSRDEALLKGAENLSLFPGSWNDMVVGQIAMKADVDLTEKDIERFNLIVLGGALDNSLTARLLPKLPITFDGKGQLIAGNREPVSLDGAGMRMAYYNPLAPDRLVFVVATEDEGAQADKWLGKCRHHLSGSSGIDRVDVADLVVQELVSAHNPEESGPDRRRMQFTHDWAWRQVEGADRKVRRGMDRALKSRRVELDLMRQVNGADFAFAQKIDADKKILARRWFTLADAATERSPIGTMVAETSGAELIAIYERWGAVGDIISVPNYKPGKIDPEKMYTITMHPGETWMFRHRQTTLADPVMGVPLRREAIWSMIFKK